MPEMPQSWQRSFAVADGEDAVGSARAVHAFPWFPWGPALGWARGAPRFSFKSVNRSKFKPVWLALGGLVLAWVLATGGYVIARSTRVTAEKVRAYLRAVDFARLNGSERERALRELARRLNALSLEERRNARFDREWSRWFAAMTEDEKQGFIEATMPTGVKQMLTSFEQLPAERRRKAVDNALKRLKEAREDLDRGAAVPADLDTNAPPALSEDVRRTITTVGLRTYYSSSSAEMKAELAPVLEELQRMMEHGAFLRGP